MVSQDGFLIKLKDAIIFRNYKNKSTCMIDTNHEQFQNMLKQNLKIAKIDDIVISSDRSIEFTEQR